MMTRDNIQGFIDGYIYSGGDIKLLDKAVSEWLGNHPTYETNNEDISLICSDINSYRLSRRMELCPSSVKEIECQ